MPLPEYSRQVFLATAIVLMHALALYGLVAGPRWFPNARSERAIAVHFISRAESAPRAAPPVVNIAITSRAPELQMPLLDIAVEPVRADRAITPTVTSTPPRLQPADSATAKLISSVEYVREPVPRYPPQSKRLREQGLVVLRVIVDEQGSPYSIEVENSSGYARLDRAARDAVARAAFRPYVEGGAPRRALVLIPIEFALTRTGSTA